MARKRMIDFNIWSDGDFISLTHFKKLFFIGSFSWADDEGRGIALAPSMKAKIFPADSVSNEEIEEAKKELNRKELMILYDDGTKYFLPKWYRVQAVPKPSQSTIPLPPKELLLKFPEYFKGLIEQYRREDWDILEVFYEITELLPNDYRTITERLLPKRKERKLKEVKGKEIKEYISQSKFFFLIKNTDEFVDSLLDCQSEEKILFELKKMTSWLIGNPGKQKRDYKRFIVNWLNRDNKKGYVPQGKNEKPQDKDKTSEMIRQWAREKESNPIDEAERKKLVESVIKGKV